MQMEPQADIAYSAGDWILNSGIQEASGGVARFYLTDRQKNAAISTEITGYSASTFVDMYRCTGDRRFLDAARKAADYLNRAWQTDAWAMPFECDPSIPQYTYLFDSGIIVRGLLAVWRACGDATSLETAKRIAGSMRQDFHTGQEFSPILDLPAKSKVPYEQRWSRSPGCYQLKAGLAWRQLWEITQDESDLAPYLELLNLSVSTHNAFLPGADSEALVMDRLHAYCYFLEGLLPVAQERTFGDVLASGIRQVAELVSRIGPKVLRSDVVAQLLRIRLFADQYGMLALDLNAAAGEAALLQSFQVKREDRRVHGGFWFARTAEGLLPFVNPVSTAFSYQALRMWSARQQDTLDWRLLI